MKNKDTPSTKKKKKLKKGSKGQIYPSKSGDMYIWCIVSSFPPKYNFGKKKTEGNNPSY